MPSLSERKKKNDNDYNNNNNNDNNNNNNDSNKNNKIDDECTSLIDGLSYDMDENDYSINNSIELYKNDILKPGRKQTNSKPTSPIKNNSSFSNNENYSNSNSNSSNSNKNNSNNDHNDVKDNNEKKNKNNININYINNEFENIKFRIQISEESSIIKTDQMGLIASWLPGMKID